MEFICQETQEPRMAITIEAPAPGIARWRYEKVPIPEMPQFHTHRVVSTDGWCLDLGNSVPEGGIVYQPFFVTFPEAIGTNLRRARFTLAIRETAAAWGRGIEPTAELYLEELAPIAEDGALLATTAEAVRALMRSISDGKWDVERLVVVE